MFRCEYCKKPYEEKEGAKQCFESHEIIYVPLSKSDLNRLAQFIMTKNEQFLTETLTKNIFKYFGG